MKMTLKKLREMDESELPDSDHPFKEDITAEEFQAIARETVKETSKIKPLKPRTEGDWYLTTEEILKAMNSSKDSY